MEKRTKKDIIKTMSVRRVAWDHAMDMTIPLIVDHGLENYEVNGNFLVKGSTMTRVDQNVDHIIHVADWLLEPLA